MEQVRGQSRVECDDQDLCTKPRRRSHHRIDLRERRCRRWRFALIGYPYDDPVIYAGVDNPPVALGSHEPVQRVCRTAVYNVRAEAGGRRDVSVTRCFVGPEPGPVIEK